MHARIRGTPSYLASGNDEPHASSVTTLRNKRNNERVTRLGITRHAPSDVSQSQAETVTTPEVRRDSKGGETKLGIFQYVCFDLKKEKEMHSIKKKKKARSGRVFP